MFDELAGALKKRALVIVGGECDQSPCFGFFGGKITEVVAYLSYDWWITAKFKKENGGYSTFLTGRQKSQQKVSKKSIELAAAQKKWALVIVRGRVRPEPMLRFFWGKITEVVAYLSYDWPITAKFKKVACRQDNLSSGSF